MRDCSPYHRVKNKFFFTLCLYLSFLGDQLLTSSINDKIPFSRDFLSHPKVETYRVSIIFSKRGKGFMETRRFYEQIVLVKMNNENILIYIAD